MKSDIRKKIYEILKKESIYNIEILMHNIKSNIKKDSK